MEFRAQVWEWGKDLAAPGILVGAQHVAKCV